MMRGVSRSRFLVATFLAMAWQPTVPSTAGDLNVGKMKYQSYCFSCHGSSGKGDGPAALNLTPKPRDLSNGSFMETLSDPYIVNVIKGGGTAVNKSPLMPAWGNVLSDKEIRDVIAYLRSLARKKRES